MSIRPPVVEVIDQALVDVLRKQTPQERLQIAADMWETARVMLRGAIAQEHPEWNEETLNHEVARRICHREVRHGYE
ncbi:hypothetical protein [uncultured Gimesia sp.]|uniref:hypothetical protein n=1 Tax=uncultured Gimesia sp. TaxID=1678688 RepID=UPI0030DC2F3E